MLWVYRFLCGYLRVEFFGDFSQKALNICAKNRISLWNSRCVKQRIICCITVKDFLKLPLIMRGSKIRVHILKKTGLPFYVNKYNKRLGILVGLVIFFTFLKLMSCFVWTIEVNGNQRVATKEIMSACETLGIHQGMLKSDVNPKIQKQQLLINLDSLAWASLNVEGCKLSVNVTEIREKAQDNSVPTNLKATADGIIKKVDITSGNCVVKVGDTVKKGDVLVSGIMEKPDSTTFVHSIGVVTANTERSITVNGTYNKEIETVTGKTNSKSVFSFFRIDIPLYLGKENKPYKSESNNYEVKLLGKKLPISVFTKTFKYIEKHNITLSKAELEKELQNQVEKQLEEEKVTDYEIINRQCSETPDGLQLTVVVSAEEDIAYQDILLFNSGN